MAKIYPHKQRNCLRIEYTLTLRGRKVRRPRYVRDTAEARLLQRRLEQLEQATRTGIARQNDIEEWIDRKWLKQEEAKIAFSGCFQESIARKTRRASTSTDYDQILKAYETYSLNATAGSGGADRNHQNAMSHARVALEWLRKNYPTLEDLTEDGIREYRQQLEGQFAPWTVFHRMTKMRLLLDQAVQMQMLAENPARKVEIRQPKRRKVFRVLSLEEVRWILETSLRYPTWINGGLPIAIRMGLYAGLRDIEMVWFSWDWIDWDGRIIQIGETVCETTGQVWIPKTHEARELDVKSDFIQYLKEERKRQERVRLLNQFVMPAGNPIQRQYLGRPLSQDAPQKAFFKMMEKEGKVQNRSGSQEADFTLYSLRHTYCTSLLRSPPHGAGLDIRTVQKRMGHSDIRTTEQYLRAIEVEKHPTDALPY